MTGELGFQLDVEANYELDDRGQLRVEIPEPTVAEGWDEGVELVSLPFELDVRRLNEDFSFTFIDGIGEARVLTIGPESPRWAALPDIAPVMIESILNTEDQNFCENEGFNWFQMRRVRTQLSSASPQVRMPGLPLKSR